MTDGARLPYDARMDTAPVPDPAAGARIVAVVRPIRLDDTLAALRDVGLLDVLIESVRGYGRQKSHLHFYEQGAWDAGFLPKVRLEFFAPAERVDAAVEAVCRGAGTGRIGDGKIFVHAVDAPA